MTAASLNYPGAPSAPRVSRRDLSTHPLVWRAVRGMFSFYTALAFAILFLSVDPSSTDRLTIFSATLGTITLWLGVTEAPRLGTARNHVVVALPAIACSAGIWASPNASGLMLGGAFFIGPLAASRLRARRQIVGHMAFALGLFGSASVANGASPSVVLTGVLVGIASTVLCFSCVVILEAAEAQGDELEVLVRRDPLTGVGNRRLLLEVLGAELPRHAHTGRHLAVLALDLDGFKAVNDELGHAAGDELLRAVAQSLTDAAGDDDAVVRQGGDEFCVVLPDTSAARAERAALAIRDALGRVTSGHHAGVSSGIGMAMFPADANDADTLLQIADERLRMDKQAGSGSSFPR